MLTNVSGSPLGDDLMRIVWENLIGAPKPSNEAPLNAKASDGLVGKYHLAEANMDFEVKLAGEDLVLAVPGQPEYKLQSTGPRQFNLAGAPDGFSVKFTPEKGDATELFLTQPQGNFTLKRVGSGGNAAKPEKTTQSGAKELIGRYSVPGGQGTIELKGESDGKVTFNISGQQPYPLVEKSKDTYGLPPLPETYWLTAKRDAAGKVISVVVTQPEGEFEFKCLDASAESKIKITVDELAAKTIEAAGGEANWRKFSTRIIEADVDLANQGVQAKTISYAKAPNKILNDITLVALGKTIGSGYDFFDGTAGEEAFTFAPAEKYAGKKLDDARLSADFYAPLNWKTNFKKVEITGMAKVGDEESYVVVFEPVNGTVFRDYYSATTHLLLKREGTIPSSTSQQQLPYTVTFSDYRDVDGIKLPFRSVNNSVTNGDIITTVKSVKHNVPVKDAVFAPRKLK
jgi:hypothetical protein